MPTGTGAQTLSLIPEVPYIIDPDGTAPGSALPGGFFGSTEKNDSPVNTFTSLPGQATPFNIPRNGVVSKLFIQFNGQLVVSTAAQTPSFEWPYGLLSGFTLSANGAATNLWSLNGMDLAALRFARYPAYVEHVDLFPGVVGGGTSIATGTYPLSISWEVPLSVDDSTLVAALFAQSSALTLACNLNQETIANLLAPGGTVADFTITGSFVVQETVFEIPIDSHGRMVLPDISRLHQVLAVDTPFTNVGDVIAELVRTPGQLLRAFTRVFGATNAPLSALPSAASSAKLDQLRLQYAGGAKKPYVYNPASVLAAKNNNWYGAPLPYDTYAIDTIKENPLRDAIYMQGVTELAIVPTVDAGVTVAAGADVHVVQEMLV